MNVNKLNADCYTVFERDTLLQEKDANVDYTLKVRLKSTSVRGVVLNLPKIKKKSNYLEQDFQKISPRKDCDAIIIDLDAKEVYLIELKRTSQASTNQEIAEQLNAGEHWWHHLAFCMGNDVHFRLKKIAVMVEERRSRDRRKRGEEL
ncbi:MAG: hypothetical protein UHX00_13085, partial [Caryophanon sp.]|nr:hypothetical protein [Caryophanon sp.]